MRKGKFRGHNRKMSVFPTNFRYDPSPPTKPQAFRPLGLGAMLVLRERLRDAALTPSSTDRQPL